MPNKIPVPGSSSDLWGRTPRAQYPGTKRWCDVRASSGGALARAARPRALALRALPDCVAAEWAGRAEARRRASSDCAGPLGGVNALLPVHRNHPCPRWVKRRFVMSTVCPVYPPMNRHPRRPSAGLKRPVAFAPAEIVRYSMIQAARIHGGVQNSTPSRPYIALVSSVANASR